MADHPQDPQQLSLLDELFETTSYDEEVDWGKFPELEEEPEDVEDELPEHIGNFLRQTTGEVTEVQKAAEDLRLATGWANVLTDKGVEVVDGEGDSVDEPDLVKAVAAFMAKPESEREVKDTHGLTGNKKVVGHVVESLVVTKALKTAMGLPASFPTGWLATVRIADDDVWQKVKKGEYRMFSMGGKGRRIPLA